MPQDEKPKESFKDKVEGIFHQGHKPETKQETKQETHQHKGEGMEQKFENYMKEDKKLEEEGKEYGGLM